MPSQNKTPSKNTNKSYGSKWANPFSDLVVSSGETVRVRKPQITDLVKSGVMDSMDMLTNIVQTTTIPVAEGRKAPVNTQTVTPEQMAAMKDLDKVMESMDKIILQVVVEPVLVVPEKIVEDPETGEKSTVFLPFEEREDGVVYLDYVELNDKMDILNFALEGMQDLSSFRKGSNGSVDGASSS